ncbi:hypothetical protein HAX54_007190 [Datura stramonium]|uniref:Uncharacterized protein n=1 Tax=Datura stramonium TaxID=4076 RepID=A0ABS8TE03_DATST|nr:hypothetical protein [Datura stramonium]
MGAKLGDHGGLRLNLTFVILVLICIYVAGFGLSWGPLGWLIPSEIFPLEIRSAGQSITVAVNFLFTFLVETKNLPIEKKWRGYGGTLVLEGVAGENKNEVTIKQRKLKYSYHELILGIN